MERAKKKSAISIILSFAFKAVGGLALLFLIIVVISLAYVFYYGSSSSNQYSTLESSNVQVVKGIVEDYHQTHTYSQLDFFVCSDMAIDVWNMVKSKGINAEIQVGNIDNPNANFTEFNHAWVLAEVEPLTWLALETTGGYVVYNETNYLYYRGFSFSTPNEFKSYVELKREYNDEVDRINKIINEFNKCNQEYEALRTSYNQNYVGRPVSNEAIEARAQVDKKLGECNTISNSGVQEAQTLSNIISEIKGLIT